MGAPGGGGTGLAGRVDSREVGAGREEMRAKGVFLQGPREPPRSAPQFTDEETDRGSPRLRSLEKQSIPGPLSGLWASGASEWLFLLIPTGGPAERAGLQQLDTVLQLNERPVEHWKCVELAHEIR